ncbi:type I restriction enzyme S subunit [Paraburkholderia sp. BL8N3]|nr:restriction endonuclease subunit S [Paraburkholderia sp. BL8N3]TCK43440.1 type I restriction enzyme S subunit [Paraburkholderia sp. BL8N3]
MSKWKSVPLKELTNPVKTWSPAEDFHYIDLGAIDQETKRIEGAKFTKWETAPSRARQLIEEGDVLVSTVRPNLNGVAKVGAEYHDATASTGFCVIRANPQLLDSSFLFHWVKSKTFVSEMVKQATGASYPAVSDRIVLGSSIPLPPLTEQRRIAAILDKSDALRTKRREALAELDTLAQSIFFHMFGDPVVSPKNCERSKLGDVVKTMQYGPRFYNEAYSPSGIRIVRITDLDASGVLDFESMPKMEVSSEMRRQFSLCPGDIVFARTGATVGKVAIISESDPECIAGAYFIRLRFGNEILPEFAFAVLQSKPVQALIGKQSRQAAQQNFSGPGLRRLPMPTPALKLQLEFADRMRELRSQRAAYNGFLTVAEGLFHSLQYRAFTGDL